MEFLTVAPGVLGSAPALAAARLIYEACAEGMKRANEQTKKRMTTQAHVSLNPLWVSEIRMLSYNIWT